MTNHPLLRATLFSCAALLLTGCESITSIFDSTDGPKLAGRRVSVLVVDQKLKIDPALAKTNVTVPAQIENANWAQNGGNATHNMTNPALGATLSKAWNVNAGQGLESHLRFMGTPVVADGKIFILDTAAEVVALDAETGRQLWRVRVSPEDARSDTLGGGIAYGGGKLYVAAGYPEVFALDPANGGMIWTKTLPSPPRAALTFADDRIYLVTLDNQSMVLSANDGAQIWTQAGIPESEGVRGQATPAVDRTVAVAPYSSGEIFALRLETGRPAWQDNLISIRHTNALWSLTDISSSPVIDQNRVYAVSVGGRFVAIDLRTGARIWQHEVGSNNMPWVAGDFIYLLDNDNELVCFSRETGGLRWLNKLQAYEDPEDRKRPVFWRGPILAGDRLIITNTLGQIVQVSPLDGTVTSATEASDRITVPPIVAGKTLYVLTNDGELTAYR